MGVGSVGGCARGEVEVGCGSREEMSKEDDHEVTRRLMVGFRITPG